MKKNPLGLLGFAGFLCVFLTAVGAEKNEKQAEVTAGSEARVRALVDAFMTAQNAHDLKAVEGLLLDSPRFLWITRGTPIWGRDAALKRFESLYQATWHLDPEIAALRLVLTQEHTAQVFVPIVFTIGGAGQASQQTRFLMNLVLIEIDGVWRVASILPIPASVSGQ